jgi:LytS/YehU family sensor histidine kinase
MYEDPAAADEMLDRLAELLRVSLRTARSDEVTLSTELATLHCYLDLMKARFGERLDVRFDVDPGLSESLVPSMILQPLVENAVRPGNAETNGRGRITIRVREDGPGMAIEVEDDGPGADPETISEGVGLTTTAERLRLLYGDDQSFSVSRIDDGFIVRLRIPGRREVTS